MKRITNMFAALAVVALPMAPLAAQERPVSLTSDVKAVKTVTEADGSEKTELVEPSKTVPGDRLVFGTDYANSGSDAVENFVVTNPIHAAVRLAPDADPALIVSVDGAKSFGVLANLSVTDQAGATRAATQADVTHVRWTLSSIAPGETGRLEYPVIIR
ncbi:MAG: hypothetical protein ABJP70_11690 [Erythrobacter sp.]